MLDHPEFQSEDDPPSARDEESTHKGGKTPASSPPASSTPHPPSPPGSTQTAKEPSKWRGNLKLGMELIGLAALIVYTVFSVLQWAQIRWTNRLTRDALSDSDKTLAETLKKMQLQADAMNRVADKAGLQADKLDASVRQASRLANDTENSTALTQQTFHASERAYVVSEFFPEMPTGCQKHGFSPRVIVMDGCYPFHYINVGKTPALSVVITVKIYVGNAPSIPEPGYNGLIGNAAPANVPEVEVIDLPNQNWSAVEALKNTGGEFSVAGYIQYKDIFGDIHRSGICDYYPIQNPNDHTTPRAPSHCPGSWIDYPPSPK